ncbi:retrotransposon protein, putative, ty1-copia subclass [Tanacetum coccineum]
MATNDKESSAAGTDNRPPMLEESDFDSWKIRIERYIHGEGEQQTQVTREKTDEEFTEAENNKERADIQATNILKQQKKETLFDQYERFRANGNESIHDYFVRFHKLINDMKITKMEIPVHQRNTKFVNNLPSYWGKYVTIVKNSKDISTVSYVDLYTHLKSYEQHAMKTLSKMNQTSGNADPLAYMITTESVQRRALGNKGKHAATGSQGKVVTCYNCRGQGHVARECKEKKRAKDSQWFKDKALLMEAKEKGAILDAEAEAFLEDVECTNLYVSQEIHGGEQLDSDVDSVIDDHDNTIPYHQYQLNNEVEKVFNVVSSCIPREIDLITILDDMRKEVSADPNLSTLEFQALETENTQLKEELTTVRIKNDSLRDENVSIKKRYQDLYKSKQMYLLGSTNVCVNLSTGIKSVTEASKSKSKCETKTHRNLPARSENVKRVDNPLRNLNKRNHVDSSLSVKRTGFISKSVSVCNICNECLVFGNHNKCGVKNLNSVNAKNPKVNNDATVKQVWKATGKIFASVGSKWRPTGRKFTLGDTCPLTRITKPEVVPLEKSGSVSTSEPANNVIVTPRFSKKPLTSYKRKDSKLKDTSIGSPPNVETKRKLHGNVSSHISRDIFLKFDSAVKC